MIINKKEEEWIQKGNENFWLRRRRGIYMEVYLRILSQTPPPTSQKELPSTLSLRKKWSKISFQRPKSFLAERFQLKSCIGYCKDPLYKYQKPKSVKVVFFSYLDS